MLRQGYLRKSLFVLFAVFLIFAGHNSAFAGISAITTPSADVTLSFLNPGRVAQVEVSEGDMVKAGDLLIRQDDAVEQAQLEQLEAQSKDTTQIRASEASLDQKKVDLKRLEWAADKGAATELEVEHARLDVKIAEISLEVAKFEHAQAQLKYKAALIRVENMRLRSPIDGTVELIEVEVGESTNALEGVIRVVRTDPLWIDIPVPLNQAAGLKTGQSVTVAFEGAAATKTAGKILSVATAADAASDTLRVRVQTPNKGKRPSGEHVTVTFDGNQ